MILTLEKIRLQFSPTGIPVMNQLLRVVGNYGLYLSNDPADLPHIFHLRFKVFFKEFSQASFIRRFYPIDRDSHDKQCIHVIVKNLDDGKIVGTYRAFVGNSWDKHYSEEQFHLDCFLMTESKKCEVGRACVHPKHRNGTVLKLLLSGVFEFCRLHQCEYLFGQSSWSIKNCDNLTRLLSYLEENNALLDAITITPRPSFDLNNYSPTFASDGDIFIPPLIKMYVMAGAKFIKIPAYDDALECFDFFTILDLKNINQKVLKLIGGKS